MQFNSEHDRLPLTDVLHASYMHCKSGSTSAVGPDRFCVRMLDKTMGDFTATKQAPHRRLGLFTWALS